MLKTRTFRNRLLTAATLAVVLASVPVPAHAASKEIIELQTQVQQLLDMVQRIQSTLDSRFGILQSLVQQTADNANQMSVTVNALQKKIDAQGEATGGKLDSVSGQVQSLNDSVDELKSRIAKLDKSVQDLQTQLQNIQNPPSSAAPGSSAAPNTAPNIAAPGDGSPSASAPAGPAPLTNQAPPLAETYQAGVRDYNAARYEVAAGEFGDVLHYYPLEDMAGAAQFYLGEIAYRELKYPDAVKDYNAVLEGFPATPKPRPRNCARG